MRIDRVKFAILIAKRDVTLKRLAADAGLSRITVSNVKCGKSCSLATVTALAKALGCTTSDLLVNDQKRDI